MRKVDLAYAAGIIDGEGCISITSHRKKDDGRRCDYTLKVEVGNTNQWLTQWLAFAFGGVTKGRTTKKNCKPCWRWHVVSCKAVEFLKLVYPYLRIKKPQADVAILLGKLLHGTGHNLTDKELAVAEAQRIAMRNLNAWRIAEGNFRSQASINK